MSQGVKLSIVEPEAQRSVFERLRDFVLPEKQSDFEKLADRVSSEIHSLEARRDVPESLPLAPSGEERGLIARRLETLYEVDSLLKDYDGSPFAHQDPIIFQAFAEYHPGSKAHQLIAPQKEEFQTELEEVRRFYKGEIHWCRERIAYANEPRQVFLNLVAPSGQNLSEHEVQSAQKKLAESERMVEMLSVDAAPYTILTSVRVKNVLEKQFPHIQRKLEKARADGFIPKRHAPFQAKIPHVTEYRYNVRDDLIAALQGNKLVEQLAGFSTSADVEPEMFKNTDEFRFYSRIAMQDGRVSTRDRFESNLTPDVTQQLETLYAAVEVRKAELAAEAEAARKSKELQEGLLKKQAS